MSLIVLVIGAIITVFNLLKFIESGDIITAGRVFFISEPFDYRPNDIICGEFDDYYSFDIVNEIDIFQDNKMKLIKICEIDDDSGGS